MRTIDEILGSPLGRKAIETSLVVRNGRPCAANFFRDVLEEIDRLAQYCQLSEFTEHGLPHLWSLIERIQTWTRPDGTLLLDALTADEAFLLLFGVVTHDIGMLSQREDDLQDADQLVYARVFADLPSWVRRTHVPRLEGVIRRLMAERYSEFVSGNIFALGCSLARSHQHWPHQEGYVELAREAKRAGFDSDRARAMAGVLAVADLLDEDSGRCDTMTLFANKAGNLMNRAHWLRHLLTAERLRVSQGVVTVTIRVPANLEGRIDGALEGLRNHVRLAQVYNRVLGGLGAEVRISFPEPLPFEAVPEEAPLELLLCDPEVHLMRSVPDEALPASDDTEPAGREVDVLGVNLRRVDRTVLDHALGPVGGRSGRSDLEITYAAASQRGEDHRLRAIKLLRVAAADAHARGEITVVRRLCSLVLGDLGNDSKHRIINDAFWAFAYSIHWAHQEHDLVTVEDPLIGRNSDGSPVRDSRESFAHLPLKWQVLGLTTQVLLLKREIPWTEISTLLERRLEFKAAPVDSEEQIAWHDLLEALWATGYLGKDVPDDVARGIAELRRMETTHLPPSKRLLSELAWRMAVQSYCLTGYGRWEAQLTSRERRTYALLPDPARESMAEVWISWFHGSKNQVRTIARQARKLNPPGSELYVAALEAEWLSSSGLEARMTDDDALHRPREFTEATERDDVYRLINSTVTTLLDVHISPKKEGTVYFGGRGGETVYAAILGERLSLRRWFLGSWHKVVGYHLRTRLSLAHTMALEGDQEVSPVLDAIQDLPWGMPYGGKSKELLESLLPRIETSISTDDLAPVLESIARSPRRVGNIRHPGLQVLGDAVTPHMLRVLADWTVRELEQPDDILWPATFMVWPVLMRHGSLPLEVWETLDHLLVHAVSRMSHVDTNTDIVQASIERAPWPIAGELLCRIIELLQKAEIALEWVEAAKVAVSRGLFRRPTRDWSGTAEHQQLIIELRRVMTAGNDPDDRALLNALANPEPDGGHEFIANRWLERVEAIKDRAVARTDSSGYSLYGDPYTIAPSRPITDEMAQRAGRALDELWAAPNAFVEELTTGTVLAGYLFRASTGIGREVLAQSLMRTLVTDRSARGFGVQEHCGSAAWTSLATHSTHFPTGSLAELARHLIQRLFDLPPEASWAQARFAMEVLLRSEIVEHQEVAQTVLLALRARTSLQPLWAAQALVAGSQRLLEELNWSAVSEQALELMVRWVEDSASVPTPETREAVAQTCRQLAQRVEGAYGQRLTRTLERLRKDVRVRVRNAAFGGAGSAATLSEDAARR